MMGFEPTACTLEESYATVTPHPHLEYCARVELAYALLQRASNPLALQYIMPITRLVYFFSDK